MSDELKPGAFFDLYGVTADDGGVERALTDAQAQCAAGGR